MGSALLAPKVHPHRSLLGQETNTTTTGFLSRGKRPEHRKPKRGPPLALSSDAVSGRPGGSEAVSAQTRLRSPAQKPLGTNERTTFLYISSRLDQRLFEATVERR